MMSSPRAAESRSSKAERSSAPSDAPAARDRRTRWCARRGRRRSSNPPQETERGREAPFSFCLLLPVWLPSCRSRTLLRLRFHPQQLEGVAEVDLALVGLGEFQVLDGADSLPDEHRPALGIEGAVARERHAIGAEEIQSAAQRGGRSAEHGVAV